MTPNNNIRTLKSLATGLILGTLAFAGLGTAGCDEQEPAMEQALHQSAVASKLIPIMSSARYKTNVATVEAALAKIEKLRGVTFDYKPEYGEPNQLGFIAEEAANVLPQSVRRDKEGRPEAMNYVAVVPVAVEAIKELSAENAALRARLEKLEAALASGISHTPE